MPELRRDLGLFSCTLMVVGGIIGSGIFFTPAEVARALPSGGWILGVWAFGGLVALAGALTYAELGALMPDAGGAYVYIRTAFGPLAAFLCGWMTLLAISTGALAAVSMGFAGYVARFVDVGPVGGQLGVAILTIVVLGATNYAGLRPGAAVQNTLTVAKIAALGGLIVAGFVWWASVGAPCRWRMRRRRGRRCSPGWPRRSSPCSSPSAAGSSSTWWRARSGGRSGPSRAR